MVAGPADVKEISVDAVWVLIWFCLVLFFIKRNKEQ